MQRVEVLFIKSLAKCHKCGHTKTRCRRKPVCRNCGEDEHLNDKTNKCLKEYCCTNCSEGNMGGTNNCEVEIQEKVNKKVQADSRVGRRTALQTLAGEDESPGSNPQSYPTHFKCKMEPEKKKKSTRGH